MKGRFWLITILAGYLLVTLAYGAVTPLFEAPDEHWHYFTAQYIKDNRQLPAITDEYDKWLSQEAAQPPLYYLLGASLISVVDTADAREQVWLNPFFYAGDASVLTNLNQVVQTPAAAWPWQGVALAAHLLRGLSTLLGLGTLLVVYGCSRLLWPDAERRALLAAAVVAFLPQYNFVHATVSNDALIIFLCAAALWQLLWLWQQPVRWPRLLLLGVTCGLAALTKNAGLLLLLYAVGFLFLRFLKTAVPPLQKKGLVWAGQTAVFVLLPAVALAGWLWLRNQRLYGDFTATEPFIRLAEGDRGYTLLQVLGETGGLVRSFFAVFGWFNLLAPAWVYLIWGGIILLAAAGGLNAVAGKIKTGQLSTGVTAASSWSKIQSVLQKNWFPGLLLFVWLCLVYAGLASFMLRTPAAQGRLLFPALVPLALGLVYGLSRWPGRWPYGVVPALALLTTLTCCFFVIRPAYQTVAQLAQLPPDVGRVDQQLANGLQLVGIAAETDTAVPGETIWFDLYWVADPVPAVPPEVVVELFGRDLALLGKSQSYHGQGQVPANLWPSGSIIRDRVGIRIDEEAEAPVWARAFMRLAPGSQTGQEVGGVKITPLTWPAAAESPLATIDNSLELQSATLDQETVQAGDTVQIEVNWTVLAPPGRDVTTLIHLAVPNQPPLATGDEQPLEGHYPTRYWAAGEVIEDHYSLVIPEDLAAGRYPVWIGIYDSETISRLPLMVSGQRQPQDVLRIGWLAVE